MKSKQQQGQKIMTDIRRILIDDWDPIGIRGVGPDDEYDSYIGGLYRLLTKNPNENEIVEHLYSIEKIQMGSTNQDREGLRTVAKKLLRVNLSFE